MDTTAPGDSFGNMSENPSASDWATARGDKWRDKLPGMEAMLAPVDEPLINALQLDRPCRIADIGCGGGGTTLEIFRRASAGSAVHGFDISPALIDSARARAAREKSLITFATSDVATAPPPEVPYGRLVSRFGIMFYDNPPVAFANLVRWLVPGGRFAFAVWGPPADNPWMMSLRQTVADVIDVPPLDSEAPGPFRYGDGDKLLGLLDHAGFGALEVQSWRGALALGGGLPPAEAADFALESFSFGALLADAGEDAFDEARRSLAIHYPRHQQGNVVRMDSCVQIVTGAAP